MIFRLLKYLTGEMMLTTKRTICSRDCYANCGLLVSVRNGRATGLRGDPGHPYSRGVLCTKSRQFLDLIYSPARLKTPLLRRGGDFSPISWDAALDLICDHLVQAKSSYGASSVLHYFDYAHSGALHNGVSRRFFRAFGGSTRPVGSLCMSAGVTALKAAIGSLDIKDFADLSRAGLIILWGANPAITNLPLLQYLQAAKRAGAKILVIDPIRTETAALADECIQVRPGSDVELALAVVRILLESGLIDQEFIQEHTDGFAGFQQLAFSLEKEAIEGATGLSWEAIKDVALTIAQNRPVSIIAGYGLQRRTNGGQIIWAVASLLALTGSLFLPGGGFYYAHENWRVLGDISGENEFSYTEKTISRGTAGTELLRLGSQIQVAVINQANPFVQNPAPDLMGKAVAQIPFVVVLDQFLTPTAQAADLVLPVTSFFEDGDLIYNSWHHYLALSEPVIEPLGESRSDPDVFLELAARLGLFSVTREALLETVIAPLKPSGVTLESLKSRPWHYDPPRASGKFRFWSGQEEGFHYVCSESSKQTDFPYTLLTPQPRWATHSQGLAAQAGGDLVFRLHPQTAAECGLQSGQTILVQTARAALSGLCDFDERVLPGVVLCYHGVWPSRVETGLNILIAEGISTAGNQATIYDCRCAIRGR